MVVFPRDVAIIGGAGHVGFPLALTFANRGLRTVIYDINKKALVRIREGVVPFFEEGAEPILRDVLARGTLEVGDSPEAIRDCRFLVLVVGTPIDEHLNPNFTGIHRALDGCLPHLRPGQTLILRSTVFPGITDHVQRYLRQRGIDLNVAFCPERVAQGYGLKEFLELPQIIGAHEARTVSLARELFSAFVSDFVEMTPMEAELCKLMANAWRYTQFAIVNQFYMIATKEGLDFDKILHGLKFKYPRMASIVPPGFTAGPCLVKDTMQLAAFSQNSFTLGYAAMMINEGLPTHLVELAKRKYPLHELRAGILGMAFKAQSDDPRDSLSYKLRKLLLLEARELYCTDPYVPDPNLVPLEDVLAKADILFVATPHAVYRQIRPRPEQIVIDVWNCLKNDE